MNIDRRRLLSLLLAVFLCFSLLAGCKDEIAPQEEDTPDVVESIEASKTPELREDEKFDLYLDELFAEAIVTDSISLNYFLADPSAFGIDYPTPTFGDVTSPEVIERYRNENAEEKERLLSFNYDDLRDEQQVLYDILMRNIELFDLMDAKDDYWYYLGSIYPVSGIQVQFPILMAEFNLRSESDIEIYLELLGDTLRYFGDLIDYERERAARGFFMSNANADDVISNCESYLENREDNLLITVFNEKIDQYEGLDDEARESYKDRNRDLVLNNVLAAYDMLLGAMRELRGQGTDRQGLAGLPDGEEYASLYLRSLTGSDRTPEQVESLIEKQMKRLLDTMRVLLASNPDLSDGYMNDTLGQIVEAIPENYLRMLEKRIIDDFPPIEPVHYTVHEVNDSLQEFTSPAFYLLCAIDDYSENVIYFNPSSITDNLSLYTTLAHEGYPGHLYQRVYSLQQSPHPIYTLLASTGYVEGWATYVEMKSYYSIGLDDREATIMQYSQLYNLLLISQIDLGINALGWSYDEVVSYLNNQGIWGDDVAQEIYGMVTGDPLSYLPYALGYLEIELLRSEAEDMLGSAFSPLEFHRFFLDIGAAPFTLIHDRMVDWLAGQIPEILMPAA